MRLNEKFVTHKSLEEHITVSVGGTQFNGMIRSNQTAGDIIECLKKDVTKEEIVQILLDKYDAPQQQIEKDVEQIVETLQMLGVIDE